MSDKIILKINNYEFTKFKSYNFLSDIYEAADAFTIQAYHQGVFMPTTGMRCEVFVNGTIELTGIIDKVSRGYDASGRLITITGRDIMGLLVDSCCESFVTLQNKTLIAVAELLLAKVPFITSIEYDAVAESRDAAKPYIQIEPGQKIFDVLRDVAASRGLLFYSNAQGGLLFRKPKGKGRSRFTIKQDAARSNKTIISGEIVDDMTSRYSKYTILAQAPGSSGDSAADINSSATVIDDTFPSGIYKPYVDVVEDDTISCKKQATRLLEYARAQSRVVQYTVVGHAQNVHNWATDELVHVDDKELSIVSDLLIYSRAFSGTSTSQTTDLILGVPGFIA